MNSLLITFTHPPIPDNCAGRFAWTIAAIRWIVFRFCQGPQGEQLGLVYNRIGRLGARFAALYASWKAGTLRPARARAAKPKSRPSAPPSAPWALASLPRRRGWLQDFLSAPARMDINRLAAGITSAVLCDAEMQEFLAAAPQAGRLLRPLLHMLTPGKLPDALRLSKRRKPESAVAPTTPPSPCGRGSGEGETPRDPTRLPQQANPPSPASRHNE